MKKIIVSGLLCSIAPFSFAQNTVGDIKKSEVERIETILSSDAMNGRKTFSADIDKAAYFISDEFKKAGLQTIAGSNTYLQSFEMVKPKFISATGSLNGNALDTKSIIVVTAQPNIKVDEHAGFETAFIKQGANLFNEAIRYSQAKKNYIVFVDTSFSKMFGRLTGLKRQIFKSNFSSIFILTPETPTTFSVEANHEITNSVLNNVVGILPGKSKKDEFVIFSGHYDHLGTGKAVDGDSIFNGANDDAAGHHRCNYAGQLF